MTTKNDLGRGGSILLIMLISANALNYLFQLIMGRLLSINDFGTMNALFSLYMIASLPFGVLTVTTARYVAIYHATNDGNRIAVLLNQLVRYAFYIALVVLGLGIMLSPIVSKYTKINNTVLLILLSISLSFGMFFLLITGAIQGTKQFFKLGTLNLGSTLIKLIAGIGSVLLGFRLYGVMGSLIISVLVMIIIGFYLLRDYVNVRQLVQGNIENTEIGWKALIRYAGIAFVVNLCIAFLSNIDMIFVKRFFTETQSGLYGTAALFGRLVFYIPNALVLAMFPIAAEAEATGNNSLAVAIKSLLYVGVLAVVCAIGLNLFPAFAVNLLMGAKFLPAVPYVRITVLMAIPVGLIVTLANYCLAIKKLKILTISMVAGCLGCWAIIEFYHASIFNILAAISITASVLFVSNLIYLFKQKGRATNLSSL